MIIEIPYDRGRAVEYAKRWALGRNPLFSDFSGYGGNCTNFVSQCLLAGGGVMNFTPTYGWYYVDAGDRAPAWSGVEAFYKYMTAFPEFADANGGTGIYGMEVRRRNQIAAGDVIQLANSSGDYYHTLLISGFADNDILVCAHTNDALDRPLSTYNYADLRVIHIIGSRLDLNFDRAYEALLNGEMLLPQG